MIAPKVRAMRIRQALCVAGLLLGAAAQAAPLSLQEAMDTISTTTGQLMDAGKFLLTIGGEHSITSPVVRATAARHAGYGHRT